MDLYGELQAINDTPDRVRARHLRREARREAIYEHVGEAIGETRAFEAAVQWALNSHGADTAAGAPIGGQHPGVAAHQAVASALSEFHIPTTYQIRFAGMKRFKGRGAHRMSDGVVTMELTLHGLSGHQDMVDVPVIVKASRVFEPVVVIHHQNIRAMTQHTFDDILKRGEFTAKIPDRKTMYSGPPTNPRPSKDVPLVRPGMYGVSPMNRSIKSHKVSAVRSAMGGFYVEALQDADDAPDHLDVGERPLAPAAPGDECKLAKALDVPGRDGYRWHLEKGTKVTIVRNRHAGTEFVVWADGCDQQLTIPGDAIA